MKLKDITESYENYLRYKNPTVIALQKEAVGLKELPSGVLSAWGTTRVYTRHWAVHVYDPKNDRGLRHTYHYEDGTTEDFNSGLFFKEKYQDKIVDFKTTDLYLFKKKSDAKKLMNKFSHSPAMRTS